MSHTRGRMAIEKREEWFLEYSLLPPPPPLPLAREGMEDTSPRHAFQPGHPPGLPFSKGLSVGRQNVVVRFVCYVTYIIYYVLFLLLNYAAADRPLPPGPLLPLQRHGEDRGAGGGVAVSVSHSAVSRGGLFPGSSGGVR